MIVSLDSLCFAVLASTFGAAATPVPAPTGVVVEKVVEREEAERAGIQPGDVLVAWKRRPNPPANPTAASGSFGTPFDVLETYIEQSPRARSLTMEFRRGGRSESASILPYPWKVETRPAFSGSLLQSYEAGKRSIETGELEKGCQAWSDLATRLSASGDHTAAAWVWLRTARAQADAGRIDASVVSFELAIAQARAAGRPDVESQLWSHRGEALANAKRYAEGETALRQALAVREQKGGDSLPVAHCLEDLIKVTEQRGAAYEAAQARALRIRQRLAPGSAAEASSLEDVAFSTFFRGDLRKAVELEQQALAIHRQIDATGSRVAYAINNLCAMEVARGNLAAAEQRCEQSLALSSRLPGETGLNLGSGSLYNMGEMALRRGDFERAKQLHLRALALREQAAGSDGIGLNLSELGSVALARGDFAEAEQLLLRAEKLLSAEKRPNSGYLAVLKNQLAQAAYGRRDLRKALVLLREGAAIMTPLDPDGAQAASIYDDLGQVLAELGETGEAEAQLRRALGLRRKHSQASGETAESSHNLGMLLWKTRRLAEAEAELRRSVEDLEAQQARLGGSEETRSVFAAEYADYYRDYLRLLMELGREEDAFLLLERYRAGSFLRTLAQRDLGAPGEVPADLERERRSINAEYERTQQELRELQPAIQSKEIEESFGQLSDLRRKQAEIAVAIGKASPRYGALRYPRSSGVAAARADIDPGTLLLSYSVGRDKSFLFALEPAGRKGGSGFSVFTLPVGEKALRESVEAFRRLIRRGGSSADLRSRSRSLYDLLLKPAEALIGRSDRLLMVSDGPLNTLPWAALARDGAAEQPRYVGEWKPIHTVVSATVYAELRKARRGGATVPAFQLAAFGDPRYPASPSAKVVERGEAGAEADSIESGDVEIDAVLRGGYRFEPLPRSRQEVETIAGLYAPNAEAFIGERATEERAKAVGRDVPLIHYACHAYVNERFPLDSALVFTIPDKPKEGQDNGLLQAWEIFEKVRIDADLVTLSACETGLGKEMGGEGLIGLTRAFQYAGARSVLASLWRVEDASTGELMERFYGYLRTGKTKDEALRLAQIDLIRSADFAQPKDWAAFQLNGDWK